jgi:hypothetical protein
MSGSDLQAYAAHCRQMSTAEHLPDGGCHRDYNRRLNEWAAGHGEGEMPESCAGCVTDADRALWGLLAAEAEAYLRREPKPTLL